jgi:hypothetical protein
MKPLRLFLSLFLLLTAGHSFAGVVSDDTGPTVEIDTPAVGALLTDEKIVFSGTADDNKQTPATGDTVDLSGLSLVQYRFAGSKKWRNAIVVMGKITITTTPATATAPATTTTTQAQSTWVFAFKLKKGQSRTVSIRGKDRLGNYGDITTVRVKRARYGS